MHYAIMSSWVHGFDFELYIVDITKIYCFSYFLFNS